MKILIIDKCIYDVGGVQNILATLANNLDIDNEVSVLSLIKNSNHSHFKYNDGISIYSILDFSSHGLKKMKRKNIKYYYLRVKEEISKKFLLKNKLAQEKDLILNSDVIIFGRIETAILLFKYLGNCFINKTVIVRDSMNLKFYDNNIRNNMKKYFPKYVTHFIVSSDECIKQYYNFFDKKIKILKIYNPIGINPKKVGKKSNKTIIAVGRMDRQKGFDMLIDVFKMLIIDFPDWKLQIYGDGLNKGKLEKIIKEKGLLDYVELKGNSSDIVSSLDNGSIFAFTSRYEGYANALVEAMACGLPCVSFDFYTGVEDIIDKNMENGIIVRLKNRDDYFNGINEQDDIIRFCDSLKLLISDEQLYENISKNAMNIYQSRKVEVIMKKWKEIIGGKI